MLSLWTSNFNSKHISDLGVVEPNLKALEWCDVANMLRVQNERMMLVIFLQQGNILCNME